VALPPAKSLTLTDAVALVKERGDCAEDEAKQALRRAGLDGRLEAIGSIPLSVHPDPAVRARHPARTSNPLRPDDWNSNIDWVSGTVGPYSSVFVKRASIEAWLGTKPTAPALAFKKASDAMVLKAIQAEYDRAKSMNEKPPNVREIVEPVQRALRAKGCEASGNHIKDLAGGEEFKERRWKPGQHQNNRQGSQNRKFRAKFPNSFRAFSPRNLFTIRSFADICPRSLRDAEQRLCRFKVPAFQTGKLGRFWSSRRRRGRCLAAAIHTATRFSRRASL
jgi:hypothetical protein